MTTFNMTFVKLVVLAATVGAGAAARAETESVTTTLPWQLRPVIADSMVRIDTGAAAFNDAQGNLDLAVPTVVSANYRLTSHWSPTIRLGLVGNNAPGAAFDGTALANPMVGATYTRAFGTYALALFGAATIPVGTGGGNGPNLRAAETNAASMAARPADAAMFAVNYVAGIAGADLAYVGHGFTVQVETTLLQFVRVRGEGSGGAADAFRTQASLGLHVGYFIGSHFSLSSDLHYRRWLTSPTTAANGTAVHITFSDAGLDTTTVAVGPRAHFQLGKYGWIHPGISVVRGLDARGFGAPLLTGQTTAVQFDIPVTF